MIENSLEFYRLFRDEGFPFHFKCYFMRWKTRWINLIANGFGCKLAAVKLRLVMNNWFHKIVLLNTEILEFWICFYLSLPPVCMTHELWITSYLHCTTGSEFSDPYYINYFSVQGREYISKMFHNLNFLKFDHFGKKELFLKRGNTLVNIVSFTKRLLGIKICNFDSQ